jgi:adenylate cyclase
MAMLSYKDAAGVVHNVPLRNRRITIGRHPDQDIQILDRVVSKAHCHVELINGRYSVCDNNSRNGTFINSIRISARRPLNNEDEICVGSTRLRFIEDLPEDSLRTRITFENNASGSGVVTKVSGEYDRRFLPESQIKDGAELRRDYEKLRLAAELQEEIGLDLNLEQLLTKILDKAFEIIPADRGVILMEDEHGDLVPKVFKNRKGGPDLALKISQTILQEVKDEKTAVLSHDAMSDKRFSGAHSIILENIRSTVSVPLLYKEALLGIIHLDSQNALGAFSEKDLQILTGFARQAAVNIQHRRLLKRMEEELVVRQNLQRLLSPQLVDEVVNGRIAIKKGGEERTATMLFADVRGFTALSERRPAQEIVALLNNYFEVMVDIIFAHHGTLDKFVGDEIMALWGAPIAQEDAEEKAVRCALAMMEGLDHFNELRRMEFEIGQESGVRTREESFEPLRIGIGINTGRVIAGYVGSSKSLSYTVMGDPVNTASRLCGVAGPGEIVIGRALHEKVKGIIPTQEQPPIYLKGKQAPVESFLVLRPTAEPHGLRIPMQAVGLAQGGQHPTDPAQSRAVVSELSLAMTGANPVSPRPSSLPWAVELPSPPSNKQAPPEG